MIEYIGIFLYFQHPRVRYAACNALGQMATDFGPTFQKKFHQKVSGLELLNMIIWQCANLLMHSFTKSLFGFCFVVSMATIFVNVHLLKSFFYFKILKNVEDS